jgi:hypothetical protein
MAFNIGRIPAIFISSTCYDLSQVRNDLKHYIEEQLGFEALLSEFNSFPLDSNIGNIENCLRVVRERADILVLIIGGRYGYIADSGKSVTNLEYINAKAKGIPIYVFVKKEILNMLKIWKDNPNADFSSIVDSTMLFDFVETLRAKENIWVYGFENAQDIISSLKRQIGYLFHDCLKLKQQIQTLKISPKVMELEGEALKIVLEQPNGWEYKLFGQVFKSELAKSYDLKRDLIYGISFGNTMELHKVDEILKWMISKCNELLTIVGFLGTLINEALPIAFGNPGEPGDTDYILYVAERMGATYENIIKWGLGFKAVIVEDDWKKIVAALFKACSTPIADLENYCESYNQELCKIDLLSEHNVEPITLNLTFTLRAPDLSDYYHEMDNMRNKYNLDLLLD